MHCVTVFKIYFRSTLLWFYFNTLNIYLKHHRLQHPVIYVPKLNSENQIHQTFSKPTTNPLFQSKPISLERPPKSCSNFSKSPPPFPRERSGMHARTDPKSAHGPDPNTSFLRLQRPAPELCNTN